VLFDLLEVDGGTEPESAGECDDPTREFLVLLRDLVAPLIAIVVAGSVNDS
jgi:hypothetical protein